MRVVILGTGALGCVFAARLAAHAETWMAGTWAEGIAAVRREGIRVTDPDGRTWHAQVDATTDPASVPPADLALVLVKSYQTERAAAWAARILTPDGIAVSLQNGLDNGPRLAAALGKDRAIVGVTYNAATLLGPGDVRHVARLSTSIGGTSRARLRLGAIVHLLDKAGVGASVTPDVAPLLWSKALASAAINPLTALWRVANGEAVATADRRAILATVAREVAAVALAKGITLPVDDPVVHVESICRSTAANRSSMLQDVERGRPIEIDSINRVIVAEGRRLGVPTPANDWVLRLVRGLEKRPETKPERP